MGGWWTEERGGRTRDDDDVAFIGQPGRRMDESSLSIAVARSRSLFGFGSVDAVKTEQPRLVESSLGRLDGGRESRRRANIPDQRRHFYAGQQTLRRTEPRRLASQTRLHCRFESLRRQLMPACRPRSLAPGELSRPAEATAASEWNHTPLTESCSRPQPARKHKVKHTTADPKYYKRPSFRSYSIFTYAAGTRPLRPSYSAVHLHKKRSVIIGSRQSCATHQSSDVFSTTRTRWPGSNPKSPGSCASRVRSEIATEREMECCVTSLVYSYSASAHSPSTSGSGSGLLGGGGGGAAALGSLAVDATRRTGGGPKLFLIAGRAAGIGAATEGGVALLLAVPCLIDENMFFPEVMSTSPNF